MTKLHVGQTLWFVPARSYYWGKQHEVTVTKIGRKWAYIGPVNRIDKSTLYCDYPPGRCYLSAADYEIQMAAAALWRKLVNKMEYKIHRMEISSDAIKKAADLLGVNLDD